MFFSHWTGISLLITSCLVELDLCLEPWGMGWSPFFILALPTHRFTPEITPVCSVTSVMSNCLESYGLQPSRLLNPWDSPDKNTGMCCYALLQRIFSTQGSNLHLLHLLYLGIFFTTEPLHKTQISPTPGIVSIPPAIPVGLQHMLSYPCLMLLFSLEHFTLLWRISQFLYLEESTVTSRERKNKRKKNVSDILREK